MATDIFPKWASEAAVSITLASLADSASVTSSAVDNNTAPQAEFWLEGAFTGDSSSNTGYVNIYINPGIDGTNHGQSFLLGSILMNGTSAVPFSLLILNPPPYFTVTVENASGDALDSSGNEMNVRGKRWTTT